MLDRQKLLAWYQRRLARESEALLEKIHAHLSRSALESNSPAWDVAPDLSDRPIALPQAGWALAEKPQRRVGAPFCKKPVASVHTIPAQKWARSNER
jgi:hypothetical protein